MDRRAPHMRPASSLRLIPRNATWKKRQWKPVGTHEDPWGATPHTRIVSELQIIHLRAILRLVLTAICNLCKVGNFSRNSNVDLQLPDVGSRKMERNFQKMDVGSWMSNSQIQSPRCWMWKTNFRKTPVGKQLSEFGSWIFNIHSSGSWKLDSRKLVWTSRLSTSPTQKSV